MSKPYQVMLNSFLKTQKFNKAGDEIDRISNTKSEHVKMAHRALLSEAVNQVCIFTNNSERLINPQTLQAMQQAHDRGVKLHLVLYCKEQDFTKTFGNELWASVQRLSKTFKITHFKPEFPYQDSELNEVFIADNFVRYEEQFNSTKYKPLVQGYVSKDKDDVNSAVEFFNLTIARYPARITTNTPLTQFNGKVNTRV